VPRIMEVTPSRFRHAGYSIPTIRFADGDQGGETMKVS
jgi:hypothetical protein